MRPFFIPLPLFIDLYFQFLTLKKYEFEIPAENNFFLSSRLSC